MRKNILLFACFASVFASAQLTIGSAQPLELAVAHLCVPHQPNCIDSLSNRQLQPENFTLRKDVREVRVRFSVTDKLGRSVASLSKNDFTVVDNGAQVAELTDFRQESDLPLQVVLLIDSSRSTERELPMEKQLAVEFLRNLLRPQDRAMIAGLSTHLRAPSSFTNRADELEQSVQGMKAEGLTAFNDAIFELSKRFENSSSARKVVIVVSDGHDTVSAHTFRDASDSVLLNDVTVYTISINDKKALDPAPCLNQLSSETGGKSYVLKDLRHMGHAFEQIDSDLRTYYVASYRAPDHDRSAYHSVNVQLAAHSLTVQNKKGYFRSE